MTLRTNLSLLVVTSLLACGPRQGAFPEDAEEASQAIVNGNFRSDVTFGGGLVSSPAGACSGTFLGPDLVLTHERCKAATRVTVGPQTLSVELARMLPFTTELVTLQLRSKAAPGVFLRTPTTRRVTAGEKLDCFGYDARGLFTSGTFTVADLAGDAIFLTGGAGFGAQFGTDKSDDGGFCMRDGGEFAAALSQVQAGSARALQVDALGPVLRDLFVAVDQSRSRVAVTLVNDPNLAVPQALTLSGTTLFAANRVARDPRQGFYLSPTAQPDVFVLVNAQTGTCVALTGFLPFFQSARGQRCNFSSASQQWVMEYRAGSFPGGMQDGYRFKPLGNQGFCLTTSGGFLLPCGLPATTMGMWLNMF